MSPFRKAYLLSCVNARFEDLHDAAEVVRTRGGRVASGVEFYLAPASAEVQAKSESNGDWKTLVDAGAIPLPPGCGTCIGLGKGLVGKGETAISATNRNFKGRMGDPDALVYLGSPAVVAASALAGYHLRAAKLHRSRRGHVRSPREEQTAVGCFGRDHRRVSSQRPRPHPLCRQGQLEHRRNLRRQTHLSR